MTLREVALKQEIQPKMVVSCPGVKIKLVGEVLNGAGAGRIKRSVFIGGLNWILMLS